MTVNTLPRPRVAVVSISGRATLTSAQAHRLEQVADVAFFARSAAMDAQDAMACFGGAEVVAVTPKVAPVFDAALLDGLPGLRGLALYATGYDFLDTHLLEDHGVVLSVLPDYSTTSVAEHTLGLLLACSRRIHLGHDRSRGLAPAGTSLRGFELDGKVLGIIGCGRIGSRVAALAQAFGMTVLAHDIDPTPVSGVRYVGRDALLRRSDLVTLHCPMAFGAPAMLGTDELRQLRPGAFLVNCSRAGLVDPAAVILALRDHRLRGYAVDDAPFLPVEVADLLAEGRLVQTGHSAWWSDQVLERGGRMWTEHIEALALRRPLDAVLDEHLDDAMAAAAGPR